MLLHMTALHALAAESHAAAAVGLKSTAAGGIVGNDASAELILAQVRVYFNELS
jgi:hypothetical protein